jgi:hypothetical protein
MANPRAAVWRDAEGRAVKTTTDELYCLHPRNLRDLASRTEDGEFEVPMRCRDCANCRRYEALVLRREIAETYKEVTDELWIVMVEAPLEQHSRLAARVRLCSVPGLEPCLYRLGLSAFALVVRGERPELERVRALRAYALRVVPIGQRRRPRDFKPLTRGLLVQRAEYTAWRNRYYHRGRARLPRETFINETTGGIRKRHPVAKAGVRAFRRGLWLDPSPRSVAKEVLASLIRRDGDLAGRQCTHKKCPPEKCLYAMRAPGAQLPINQRPRASAASASAMPGIPIAAPAGGDDRSVDRTRPEARHTAGAATFARKTFRVSNSEGRDAGSLSKGARWIDEMRERWLKKGWLKPENTS